MQDQWEWGEGAFGGPWQGFWPAVKVVINSRWWKSLYLLSFIISALQPASACPWAEPGGRCCPTQAKGSEFTHKVFAVKGIVAWLPEISFPICLQNGLYRPQRSRENTCLDLLWGSLGWSLLGWILAGIFSFQLNSWKCSVHESLEKMLNSFLLNASPIAVANKKEEIHYKPNFYNAL